MIEKQNPYYGKLSIIAESSLEQKVVLPREAKKTGRQFSGNMAGIMGKINGILKFNIAMATVRHGRRLSIRRTNHEEREIGFLLAYKKVYFNDVYNTKYPIIGHKWRFFTRMGQSLHLV